jgi:voltage-gated potassium channel
MRFTGTKRAAVLAASDENPAIAGRLPARQRSADRRDGLMLIEGWGFLDSFYMAVITITTVGFREVHELGRAGQMFVIVYLLLGFGTFFYGVVELGGAALRFELGQWLGKRRMDMTVKALREHVIVCGFGRMGGVVCRHLAAKKVPFVVIERDAAAADRCHKHGWRA